MKLSEFLRDRKLRLIGGGIFDLDPYADIVIDEEIIIPDNKRVITVDGIDYTEQDLKKLSNILKFYSRKSIIDGKPTDTRQYYNESFSKLLQLVPNQRHGPPQDIADQPMLIHYRKETFYQIDRQISVCTTTLQPLFVGWLKAVNGYATLKNYETGEVLVENYFIGNQEIYGIGVDCGDRNTRAISVINVGNYRCLIRIDVNLVYNVNPNNYRLI